MFFSFTVDWLSSIDISLLLILVSIQDFNAFVAASIFWESPCALLIALIGFSMFFDNVSE